MNIAGENTIPAPRQSVWEALNDPDILAQCIPGCEALELVEENRFSATVTNRIGPVTAKFSGEVQLSDLTPPESYKLSGSGSAGTMGNAKGAAKVMLEEVPEGTKLSYDVDVDVTGKIAQLGGRLIKSTAGVLAGQFFTKLADVITEKETGVAVKRGMSPALKIAYAAIAAIAAVVAYFLFLA